MFLFPLLYLFSFLQTIKLFLRKNASGILVFLLIGLPIYINALSVTYVLGFKKLVPLFQFFKEAAVIIGLGIVLAGIKKKPNLHKIDHLVLFFLGASFVYVLLPIGNYSIVDKLLALKSVSFFCMLYLLGRFIPFRSILLSKIVQYMSIVTIIAAIVTLIEFITDEHLHTKTGFSVFLEEFFGGEVSGNYGLIWTFETDTGFKRFGSIFSSPLEFGAAMVLSLAVFLGWFTRSTTQGYQLILNKYTIAFLTASLIGVFFALSRASIFGFLLIVILYAFLTKNKMMIKGFYLLILAVSIYFIYFLSNNNIYDFIIGTINFSNPSSLGHIAGWLEGLNAFVSHPFGMGLGESGRVASTGNGNTGGENQFIITGVQLGVPLLIVYIMIQYGVIKMAWKNWDNHQTKLRKIALIVFLFKMGSIILMFTSNTESFIYISYFSWFLSGLLINGVSLNQANQHKIMGNTTYN